MSGTAAVPGDELERWERLLAVAPDEHGGAVVLLATDSTPPAVALLTTASVVLDGDGVQIAVQAASSVARRPAESCTLVVGDGTATGRLEVALSERREAGGLVVLSGRVVAAPVMAEAPWVLTMWFQPGAQGDAAPLLRFWADLRRWLRGGAAGRPPTPG
jgi:hypothetical protein